MEKGSAEGTEREKYPDAGEKLCFNPASLSRLNTCVPALKTVTFNNSFLFYERHQKLSSGLSFSDLLRNLNFSCSFNSTVWDLTDNKVT